MKVNKQRQTNSLPLINYLQIKVLFLTKIGFSDCSKSSEMPTSKCNSLSEVHGIFSFCTLSLFGSGQTTSRMKVTGSLVKVYLKYGSSVLIWRRFYLSHGFSSKYFSIAITCIFSDRCIIAQGALTYFQSKYSNRTLI